MKQILITEQGSIFNFKIYIEKNTFFNEQLNTSKKVMKIIERDYIFYNNLKKILIKNKLDMPKIIIYQSYNKIFKFESDYEIPACYLENNIYLFANKKIKINRKEIRNSITHEFGHFLMDSLNYKEFSKLTRIQIKDWILSKKNIKEFNKDKLKNYLRYIAPVDTNYNRFIIKPKDVINNIQMKELFAEVFSLKYSLFFDKSKNIKKNKFEEILNFFPNTNYFIEKKIKIKQINKYKSLKSKKIKYKLK